MTTMTVDFINTDDRITLLEERVFNMDRKFEKKFDDLTEIMLKGFDDICQKFNIIDNRLDVVESRLDNVENRLVHIETRLDSIDKELIDIKNSLLFIKDFIVKQ